VWSLPHSACHYYFSALTSPCNMDISELCSPLLFTAWTLHISLLQAQDADDGVTVSSQSCCARTKVHLWRSITLFERVTYNFRDSFFSLYSGPIGPIRLRLYYTCLRVTYNVQETSQKPIGQSSFFLLSLRRAPNRSIRLRLPTRNSQPGSLEQGHHRPKHAHARLVRGVLGVL